MHQYSDSESDASPVRRRREKNSSTGLGAVTSSFLVAVISTGIAYQWFNYITAVGLRGMV
jgi:hypothetical protein